MCTCADGRTGKDLLKTVHARTSTNPERRTAMQMRIPRSHAKTPPPATLGEPVQKLSTPPSCNPMKKSSRSEFLASLAPVSPGVKTSSTVAGCGRIDTGGRQRHCSIDGVSDCSSAFLARRGPQNSRKCFVNWHINRRAGPVQSASTELREFVVALFPELNIAGVRGWLALISSRSCFQTSFS